MSVALYRRDGERFVPTEATRSPWHPGAQHGGPPAALAVRAVEALAPPGMDVLRVTAELLGEIPLEALSVSATVERPGRRVALFRAVVEAAGAPIVVVSAWAARRAESLPLPPPADPFPDAPPPPESLPTFDYTFRDYTDFFGTALDKRLIRGRLDAPGRAALWFRLRVPLVAGEEPTALQRLVTMVDSGNGISWALPIDRFVFPNMDLNLTLSRAPVGEWFATDSVSHLDPGGRGIAETVLFDTAGWLGRSTQLLYVDLA